MKLFEFFQQAVMALLANLKLMIITKVNYQLKPVFLQAFSSGVNLILLIILITSNTPFIGP